MKKPVNKMCSVEGCESQSLARRMCGKHYKRWSKYGPEMVEFEYRGENIGKSNLTDESVREIRKRSYAGETYAQLAAVYGVAEASIGRIVRRQSWIHITDEVE